MLNTALDRHARTRPGHEALVTGAERVSYATLRRRVCGLCDRLRAVGVGPGTIVPLMLDNDTHFVVALLAVLRLGAHPLPLPPSTPPDERAALLAGLTIPVKLVNAGLAAAAQDGPAPLVAEPFVQESETDHGGHHPGAELLVPTSGSTGQPRIARLSEAGSVWNALAHAESIGLGPDDRVLVVSPMYHSATLVAQLIATLWHGGTLVLMRGPFMPRAYLKAIETERITVSSLTPTHVRLIQDKRSMRSPIVAASDLSSLETLTIGAAPIEPTLLREFAAEFSTKTEARVHVTYGLTEAGPRVTTLPAESLNERADSIGLPLRGIELRVVDLREPELPLPAGTEGELQVRTPSRMIGYLGEDPLKDGWLSTGDLAVIDSAGFVALRGRLKEIIVSGGANVSSWEVEQALCADGRVHEAAVVGEPHEVFGEIVRAYVVPSAPVDTEEVIQALSTRLAPYKLPRKVTLVDALPRTPSGKVDKCRLRQAD